MPFEKINTQDVLAFQKKIQDDPVWFISSILKSNLWEKQKDIVEAVKNNAEVAVKSCNASGKTYVAARIVHWWLLSFPNSIVITTAPTGRQVREVLWREIRNAVSGIPIYPSTAILETKINIDNQWYALGLSTDQPDQFQGFHSAHLLVIVDEASGVEDSIFEAIDGLKPTKLLLLGNPLRRTGRFARDFSAPNVKKITISAFDTPNIQAKKNIIPGLVALEDIEKLKLRYGEDSDVYRVRVLGEFPKVEDDVLISIEEVVNAMNRSVEVMPEFEKKLGVDVARYGDDRSVLLVRQMEKVLRKEIIINQDLMSVAGQVLKIAREEGIRPENIFIDVIGYGAGVVDRLKEQGWDVVSVNVASPAHDTEHYANLRAELYGQLKEWLKTGQLLQDDDFYELTNIKYHFTSKGQLQLESKEDMKKRGLSSPDVADALALTFATTTGKGQLYYPNSVGGIAPYYPDIGI